MKFLILFTFSLLVASSVQDECLSECPQDCGMTGVDGNGCAVCDCSKDPFGELPPPPPPSSPSKRDVSEDEPPMTDGDLCRKMCPQDCGCSVENGTATCHCTAENHPLIRTTIPTPPPPPPPSKREVKEDEPPTNDSDLCSKTCPQDCGCLVENGVATCHCTAENHPLINKDPTPTPPTPNKREVKEDEPTLSDGDLCRRKCPQDCGCLVENGTATCHCTAENHPLIRPTPPRPKCNKALPTCEAPCKLEFVENKLCPECKCA